MSLRGTAERFLAMVDTADRRSQAEGLVTEIANALAVAGEYVARVNLEQTQRIVDFSWAARQAGRRLGIRVEVTSHLLRADEQMQVQVRALDSLS